jgi:hypothetical protein
MTDIVERARLLQRAIDDLGAGPARRCRHPRHSRLHSDPLSGLPLADGTSLCGSCLAVIDGRTARRGKNNRSRGNAIEREVGKSLGLTRVGMYGTPTDLGATAEPFAVQVKSGGAFPERFWAWLKAIPAKADQTPLLVVTDAPGPGRKRRAVVVLDLAEWVALHGPSGVAE